MFVERRKPPVRGVMTLFTRWLPQTTSVTVVDAYGQNKYTEGTETEYTHTHILYIYNKKESFDVVQTRLNGTLSVRSGFKHALSVTYTSIVYRVDRFVGRLREPKD